MSTYVIIIGVSQYQDLPLARLPGAEADALLFARSFRGWGVPEKNISLFLNESATLDAIHRRLLELKSIEQPFHLVFFYSGHGFRSSSQSFLLLHQSKLYLDDLVKQLSNINARETILFLDACHLRINTLINPAWQSTFSHKNFFCLLSSGIYPSFENREGEYGFFTASLMRALSLLRQSECSPDHLLEEICRELKAKGLAQPEMYNIDTHTFRFFPALETSRMEVRAKVCDLLIQHPNKIIGLVGEPGIGKTTFCRQFAFSLDRTFYFNFFPCLEELPPHSLAIIDASLDIEQIDALLESKCRAILTSRTSFPEILQDRLIEFKLPPLDFHEAKKLIPLDPQIQQTIFLASRGNPSAISQILSHPDRPEIRDIHKTIAALVACGAYLNEALFSAIFTIQKKELSFLKEVDLLFLCDDLWMPHESLFLMAETENVWIDSEKAIQYWCRESDENPKNFAVAKSLITTLRCMGYSNRAETHLYRALKLLQDDPAIEEGFALFIEQKVFVRSTLFLARTFIKNNKIDQAQQLLRIPSTFSLAKSLRKCQILFLNTDWKKKKYFALSIGFALLIGSYFFFHASIEPTIVMPESYANFVGREEILSEIKQKLLLKTPFALCGQGGIGKSETAIQFAHRNSKKFSFIYWINAGSEEIYQQSYCDLARYLHLPINKKMPFETIKEKVHLALEHEAFNKSRKTHKPWLLIFDNADHQIKLPQKGNGRILITARDKTKWENIDCIELSPFSQKTANELFYKVMPEHESIEEWNQLASELDYLPLALDQALHFIKESPLIDFVHYRKLLGQSTDILQQGHLNKRYPQSLFAMWQISTKELQEKDPQAYEWLQICAFLHPDKIPMEWASTWLQQEGRVTENEAKIKASAILSTLAHRGYINVHKKEGTFSIHRLKQKLLQQDKHISLEKPFQFLARMVKQFEYCDHLETEADMSMLSMWETSAAWLADYHRDESENGVIIFQVLGNVNLIIKKEYKEALERFKQAEMLLKKIDPKEESCSTIINYLNQGFCFFLHGYYTEAEKFYLHALEISQKISHNQPSLWTATCLCSMAMTMEHQCEDKRALEYCEQALDMVRPLRGRSAEFLMCETIKWLGAIWIDLKDFEKAMKFSLQALELNKLLHGGKPNLNDCYILHNMGMLYREMGNVPKALDYHLLTLKLHERLFPNEYQYHIYEFVSIASVYKKMKNYKKSWVYLKKTMKQIEEFHADRMNVPCIYAFICIAGVYLETNDPNNALPYYQRALENAELIIKNKNHDIYQKVYDGLSQAYEQLGQYDDAQKYQQLLDAWKLSASPNLL